MEQKKTNSNKKTTKSTSAKKIPNSAKKATNIKKSAISSKTQTKKTSSSVSKKKPTIDKKSPQKAVVTKKTTITKKVVATQEPIKAESSEKIDKIIEQVKKEKKDSQKKKRIPTSEKKKSKLILKPKVRIFLICILSMVFLYTTSQLVINYYDMHKNKLDHNNLVNEVFHTVPVIDEETGVATEEEITVLDFDKLLSINSDIKGWIRFNQDKVNYPIVQGKDNNYYLRRNLEKKYSTPGTIFLDYRNVSFDDKNAILFGHAMSDKTMFGTLEDVFHNNFWKDEENNRIEIITKDTTYIYQIFSYYTIEKEEYYITPSFGTNDEFKNFINTIMNRSWQKLGINVTTKDHILTLSTCAGVGGTSERRVIHAVRTEEFPTENAKF